MKLEVLINKFNKKDEAILQVVVSTKIVIPEKCLLYVTYYKL